MVTETINTPALRLKAELNEGATHEQAMEAVDMVCQAINKQEASAEALRLLLGRMMVEIQDKKLYNPEFSTFEEFTKAIAEKHRLSRTTVRDGLMIARRLPQITIEDAEAMPSVNLTLVARAAKNAPKATITRLIKDAKRMNIYEFRNKLTEKGLVTHRTTASSLVVIRFKVTKAVFRRWVSYVGDSDPADIFAELIPARTGKKAA